MPVRIRLTRKGRKKLPFYRIVVQDSRSPRDGRFIDKIGYYNPLPDPRKVEIDEEKAIDWLKKGAQPTDTVKSLFKSNGILFKYDLIKKGLPEDKIQQEIKKLDLIREEQNKRKEAEAAMKAKEKAEKEAKEKAKAEAEAKKAEEEAKKAEEKARKAESEEAAEQETEAASEEEPAPEKTEEKSEKSE